MQIHNNFFVLSCSRSPEHVGAKTIPGTNFARRSVNLNPMQQESMHSGRNVEDDGDEVISFVEPASH